MWLKFSIAFPSLPFPHHHVLLSWGSSTWVLSTDRNADGYPTTCLCFPGNDSRGGTFLCLPHVCAHTLHTLFFFKGSYSICCFFSSIFIPLKLEQKQKSHRWGWTGWPLLMSTAFLSDIPVEMVTIVCPIFCFVCLEPSLVSEFIKFRGTESCYSQSA